MWPVRPDNLWRELQRTERYELQALVVALAALVPVDQPGLAGWLKSLSRGDARPGSVSEGLALLIPEFNGIYRRCAVDRRRNKAR